MIALSSRRDGLARSSRPHVVNTQIQSRRAQSREGMGHHSGPTRRIHQSRHSTAMNHLCHRVTDKGGIIGHGNNRATVTQLFKLHAKSA